jgi:hypothetical protein
VTSWLRRFGERFGQQLTLTSGSAGISAIVLALAGLLVSGLSRNILIGVGVLIAVVTVLTCVSKAWPPPVTTPSQLGNREIPLADLDSIEPPVPAIGIIGPAAVGKTTLMNGMLQFPTPGAQSTTQRVTAHVSPVLRESATYFAIIDGRGDSFAQQFEVAEHSDIILLLLDHNDLNKRHPNDNRLAAHANFGDQLREFLNDHRDRPKQVHLLLNKKDLWIAADSADQTKIKDMFATQVQLWTAAFGSSVSSAEHTNDSSGDISAVVEAVRQHWRACRLAARK